ncbi:MAG: hypothetical protein ACPGUD_13240 [Parashewanella sp.]
MISPSAQVLFADKPLHWNEDNLSTGFNNLDEADAKSLYKEFNSSNSQTDTIVGGWKLIKMELRRYSNDIPQTTSFYVKAYQGSLIFASMSEWFCNCPVTDAKSQILTNRFRKVDPYWGKDCSESDALDTNETTYLSFSTPNAKSGSQAPTPQEVSRRYPYFCREPSSRLGAQLHFYVKAFLFS